MELYDTRSILPTFSPAVLQTEVVGPFFHSRLVSPGCCSGSALQALLRPVIPYTLALSVALSAGSPAGGTSRTSTPSWRCRQGRLHPCSLAGNRGVPVWMTFKSRLASLGYCSGCARLVFLWSAVPYTLALSAALSTGGVSGSGAFQQRSPGRPISPIALLQGGSSSL